MKRIKNDAELLSHGDQPIRKCLLDIMEHGLQAADPYYNVTQLMHMEGNELVFSGHDFEPASDPNSGEARFDLTQGRVFLFAIGKGIQRAAKAVEDIVGTHLSCGFVLAKHGDPLIMERSEVMLGAHPLPDENCVTACRRMLDILQHAALTENDLVITIVGNGVSSLLTLPIEGVRLQDVIDCVSVLQIESGLPTSMLNHIRNNVDQLKGGRLSQYFLPAKAVHLVAVSPTECDSTQVQGYQAFLNNNFWLHTLPDSTSQQYALEFLHAQKLISKIPPAIVRALQTPQARGITPAAFSKAGWRIFALMPPCRDALHIAARRAEELGLNAYILTKKTQCEAAAVGRFVAMMARQNTDEPGPFHRPCALLLSGEMLVTCGENAGVGGRNQEFCLAAAIALRGYHNIAVSSVDTDGTDGPGGYICAEAERSGVRILSGGIVDGTSAQKAQSLGIDLSAALAAHAASAPLWHMGDALIASQNVSVGDLSCCIIL